MEQFLESLAWQGFRSYRKKPGKDLNGLITTARLLQRSPHLPKYVRQPTYSVELVEAVLKLRETYPRWGKDKLVVLLHREGFDCSA